jgi:hypothetical protein
MPFVFILHNQNYPRMINHLPQIPSLPTQSPPWPAPPCYCPDAHGVEANFLMDFNKNALLQSLI